MICDDDGPAFPCLEPTMTGISSDGEERFETEAHSGMSLRDYFAAKALQGTLASPQITGNTDLNSWSMKDFAEWSYGLADAMLEARQS